MCEKGFDQLPFLAPSPSRRLIGIVTLGNLLSRISYGRTTGKSPMSEVMFDFSNIYEIIIDHTGLSALVITPSSDLDYQPAQAKFSCK